MVLCVARYPSISVCKRYIYDNTYKTEELLKNASVKLWMKKKAVMENTWNRDELMFFLNHPQMLNLTFPCTSRNGIDPGKPCVFMNSSNYMSNFNSCDKWFARVCYTNIISNREDVYDDIGNPFLYISQPQAQQVSCDQALVSISM